MAKTNDFFKTLLKDSDAKVVSDIEDEDGTVSFVDTGSYALNALVSGSIYGGFPTTKVVALAGEESTGKSFYALAVVKNFLDENPDAGCVYFESEGALDESEQTKELLVKRGIDVERFYLAPIVTIQDFRTKAIKIVDEYLAKPVGERQPMIFVLDSLGNTSTNKEVSDIAEGKDTRDMTRSQLIRGAFRVLALKLNKARIPMLVTNHTYDVIGAYMPTKEMSGGGGLKYAASIILFLSKSKKKDATTNEVTGALIKVFTDKSRFTKEKQSVVTLLDYEKGLNRYYGLLPIAEAAGVVKKVSTKYQFPGGATAFESVIYKNPEKYFTKEVLDQIEEAAKSVFNYGSTVQLNAED